MGVAPYYVDTPFLGAWTDWTPDSQAQKELEKSAHGKKFLRWVQTKILKFKETSQIKYLALCLKQLNIITGFSPGEAALKIFNVCRGESGSIWLLRPGMLPPFNVPDYKLPQVSSPLDPSKGY